MPVTDPEHLKMLEGSLPISRDDPRRAKDFVKCVDQNCCLNKQWAERIKRFGWTADDYEPHCHPVF